MNDCTDCQHLAAIITAAIKAGGIQIDPADMAFLEALGIVEIVRRHGSLIEIRVPDAPKL